MACQYSVHVPYLLALFIKINLQTRLLIVTRLVNEADIVNKTRPLFTLSLEMTRLVNGDQASISTWC